MDNNFVEYTGHVTVEATRFRTRDGEDRTYQKITMTLDDGRVVEIQRKRLTLVSGTVVTVRVPVGLESNPPIGVIACSSA